MNPCILIQANGNNERLGKFFSQPKYELFYGKEKIIDIIIRNSLATGRDVYMAVREDTPLNFDSASINILPCTRTTSRIGTLLQCFPDLKKYDSIIIHDSDVIIAPDVLMHLSGDCIALGSYRLDGLKYGFVKLDSKFNYVQGNEKQEEEDYITIGAYSVDYSRFSFYMKKNPKESLLYYYNQLETAGVVYSADHICLGDINSYMENLWLL